MIRCVPGLPGSSTGTPLAGQSPTPGPVRGCAALLADACVQIVDAMSAAQSACAVPGASSVSNDGYSVTFASGALSERLAAEAQSILSNALGSDPHGLLYRGCF